MRKRLFILSLFILLLRPAESRAQANSSDSISAASSNCSVLNSCVILQVQANTAAVSIQITGTFSATIQFEATSTGTNWVSIAGVPVGGGTAVTSATAAGAWQLSTPGLSIIRARASTYASGAASTRLQTSPGSIGGIGSSSISGQVTVVGPAADGAAVSGNPVRVAGKDGSGNTQDIITNTTGNVTLAYGDGTQILPTDVVHTIVDSGSISPLALTPVFSAALESNHVICAAPCSLYSAYVTTGATAGYFLVANATSAPTAGGAAIAPIACVQAPASSTISIGGASPAIVGSTGITLVFSTSGCLTNTASATAFFSGQKQ